MADEKMNLLCSWTPFDYTSDMIQESKELNGGKIVLKGILQKSDTLNQNGRVYPRVILEREIRNYQNEVEYFGNDLRSYLNKAQDYVN